MIYNFYNFLDLILLMNKKVIIIIGLPGSGKTTLAKKFKDYLIFDDFIGNFYNGDVIYKLKSKSKICLIDPRLCIYSIFLKYFNVILKYVSKEKIQIIIFENDPKKCLINLRKRRFDTNIQNIINNYSHVYSLKNYIKFNPIILPIYTSSNENSNQPL